MLTKLEKRELNDTFQLVMVNNTKKGLDGWKKQMQVNMNEKGWSIDKQNEALKYLGII